MTRKSKKLGVKTSKSTVVNEENNKATESAGSSNGSESTASSKNNVELEQLCSTIDKLTFDMLILVQRNIQKKINLEKTMTEGELHLSKSRYIMGLKNVSALQIPAENVQPSATVEEHFDDEAMFGKPRLQLATEGFTTQDDKETDADTKNIQNPVNWFGYLVPKDLRSAQTKYKDALSYVVECANIQIRFHETCIKIKQLINLKNEMIKAIGIENL